MTSTLTWLPRLLAFLGWYALELVKTNVALGRDMLTPGIDATPGIVRLPLRCRTDFEVTLISSLISLTPGTLTLGAREEPRTIWVHGMYHPDPAELRADLWEMERRMLVAVRREGFTGPPPTRASTAPTGTEPA